MWFKGNWKVALGQLKNEVRTMQIDELNKFRKETECVLYNDGHFYRLNNTDFVPPHRDYGGGYYEGHLKFVYVCSECGHKKEIYSSRFSDDEKKMAKLMGYGDWLK